MLKKFKINSTILFLMFPLSGILFTLSGGSLYAQDVEVEARIDSISILIGDQTDLWLKINQPDSFNITFPEFAGTIAGSIEIINQTPSDTLHLENRRLEITRKYKITCFDSGYHHIPPFSFQYKKDSFTANWSTQPLFLHVSRVDIAPSDSSEVIFDIKLPAKAPITLAEILPWIMGVVLIGIVVFLVVYYLRKRKKQEPLFKIKKPEEPPHVIALRELDRLKADKLWQKGKIKSYYSELTGIIRKYIEKRYQVSAMEQTSNEIIEALLNTGFNNNKQLEQLKIFLFSADMVKFAKAKPLPDENETALLNAYIFVNETKQTWQKELDDQKERTVLNSEKVEEWNDGMVEEWNNGTKQ
ncbi:MAG: hypothetical protein IIB05_07145 [Bacteroidetes bacterium]|nr:hypothetical protein [Bacteroidota bacterium]